MVTYPQRASRRQSRDSSGTSPRVSGPVLIAASSTFSTMPPRSFGRKGYEGASMRDLSRATGMSLAGLYHYFESKERLLS